MTDETKLPSQADLDAHSEEESVKAATGGSILPTPTDAEIAEAAAYAEEHLPLPPPSTPIEQQNYGPAVTSDLPPATAGDATAKDAHDAALASLTKPEFEGPYTVDAEPVPHISNRHGEIFSRELHAVEPTGEPKQDSTGKFILKAHDYTPTTPNIPGGK